MTTSVTGGTVAARVRAMIPLGTGLAAQAVQYGSSLLLLFFVVTHLPKVDAEIWYVFVTIQGLATLADFGFQPTIARAFSAAYAGADALRREGLGEAIGEQPNQRLVGSLIQAARRLYLMLAMGLALLLLTAGFAYIEFLVRGHPADAPRIRMAWLAFSAATASSIYFLWVSPLLTGAGRFTANYVYIIASKGGAALLGVLALVFGGGMIALAASGIVAAVIARVAVSPVLSPLTHAATPPPHHSGEHRRTLGLLLPNAMRLGASSFGAFLGTRLNVLILSTFVSLSASASYAVTLQLLSAIFAVGQLPTLMSLPRLVKLRMTGPIHALWRLFLRYQAFLILTAIVGIAMLALFGQPGLRMVGSHIRLLDTWPLLALATVLLLEFNHSNCGFFIASANNVPFMLPILISGGLAAALAGAAAFAGLGIGGVIASQFVVQLAYNNWKWPLTLYREIGPPVWTAR